MKKHIKTLILATALSTVCISAAEAGGLQIINNTDKNIQVFIRGAKSSRHFTELLTPNSNKNIIIEEAQVDNQAVFEVIASTGNGGDPDWKLLGGKCDQLLTKRNHTLLIETSAGGLKTSCTTLE